jgi:serine/threonine-protein kinase CHEK2
VTATPPKGRQGQGHQPPSSLIEAQGFSSPPQDTQAFSQFPNVPSAFGEVENEAEEGVWGYLIPLDQKYGKSLVLSKHNTCPNETEQDGSKSEETPRTKAKAAAAGGYLIGRHPECGKLSSISSQDKG